MSKYLFSVLFMNLLKFFLINFYYLYVKRSIAYYNIFKTNNIMKNISNDTLSNEQPMKEKQMGGK